MLNVSIFHKLPINQLFCRHQFDWVNCVRLVGFFGTQLQLLVRRENISDIRRFVCPEKGNTLSIIVNSYKIQLSLNPMACHLCPDDHLMDYLFLVCFEKSRSRSRSKLWMCLVFKFNVATL